MKMVEKDKWEVINENRGGSIPMMDVIASLRKIKYGSKIKDFFRSKEGFQKEVQKELKMAGFYDALEGASKMDRDTILKDCMKAVGSYMVATADHDKMKPNYDDPDPKPYGAITLDPIVAAIYSELFEQGANPNTVAWEYDGEKKTLLGLAMDSRYKGKYSYPSLLTQLVKSGANTRENGPDDRDILQESLKGTVPDKILRDMPYHSSLRNTVSKGSKEGNQAVLLTHGRTSR